MPALGWTPDVFWLASISDFFAAVEGYALMNGAEETGGGFSRDDYERLKAQVG
ncbi:hypothetical protein [Roseibium sp. RKSG952]|uniref:hypothetical protein n=1 Tax=Roseibium sp. RKSG952 TaxID=2529384 RepID=UPI0012BCA65B|nr:hypothetical protein [Roseibium sp. RKSG952]